MVKLEPGDASSLVAVVRCSRNTRGTSTVAFFFRRAFFFPLQAWAPTGSPRFFLAAHVARIFALCSSVHRRFFFFPATSSASDGSGVRRAFGGGSVGNGVGLTCLTSLSPDSGSVVRRRTIVTSGFAGSSASNGRCVSGRDMHPGNLSQGQPIYAPLTARLITRPLCHATFSVPFLDVSCHRVAHEGPSSR